jgi:iron complex outermembrane receptor protein
MRNNFYTRFCLFVVTLFISFIAGAQQSTVVFKVRTPKNEVVPFATVILYPVTDSTKLLRKVADSTGTVSFKLDPNNYTVKMSAVNFQSLEKGIAVKATNQPFVLVAQPDNSSLAGVVVTSRKPLMRQEDDKTIVDPETLASSSTSAYEVLEKTPGLFVDQDGNIYLSSTTPATIYINGREQKMSTADVAAMLKSLPPNSIASIEILRTPSAKYDASGGGGVVNVILKKNVKIGLTGSVTLGINQGRYGNQTTGLNLNNNNGKLTTYLVLQAGNRKTYEQIKTDRNFAPDSLLSQDALTVYPSHGFYMGYGFNYQLNKKWEISYDGRVNINRSNNNSTNPSIIKKLSTNQLITSNEALVNNKGKSLNVTNGMNLKYKIDSLGSEWSNDVSFTYAPNKTEQNFVTNFTTPFVATSLGNGTLDNTLHVLSVQTNLVKKLKGQFTIETGLKSSKVWFDNATNYYRQSNGVSVKDNNRSRSYEYSENINAAYFQASKNFSGFIVKAGTRVENTNMHGESKQVNPVDTTFKQNRTDAFPYIYLSRNIMKIAGFDLRAYLVYRRTISRPSYDLLNPSIRRIDQYLNEMGNPSLRPQFTKNYEANISVNETPLLAIGYNDTKDIFTQVIYQADSSKSIGIRTYDNLGTNKETYFRALGAIPPGKKYFFVVGAQYNHNFYTGLYENKPLLFKKGSWTIFTYHTLKLAPTTQLTLNGFARFKGQLQFYEVSNFGSLNMSVIQQFLKKKLTVTASVQDIFFTNNNEFTIKQGSVAATGFRKGDTRRFGLNMRYNFGFRKKEENNMFNVESPERNQ